MNLETEQGSYKPLVDAYYIPAFCGRVEEGNGIVGRSSNVNGLIPAPGTRQRKSGNQSKRRRPRRTDNRSKSESHLEARDRYAASTQFRSTSLRSNASDKGARTFYDQKFNEYQQVESLVAQSPDEEVCSTCKEWHEFVDMDQVDPEMRLPLLSDKSMRDSAYCLDSIRPSIKKKPFFNTSFSGVAFTPAPQRMRSAPAS